MPVYLSVVYGCFPSNGRVESFVAIETVGTAKLKIVIVWSFTEKVCRPLV